MPNGERMPLLLGQDLVALYYPTLFATSQVRNASESVSSMRAQLDSIKLLYVWALGRDIDLEARFASRAYLNGFEIEDLSRFVGEKRCAAHRSYVGATSRLRDGKLYEKRRSAGSRYRHLMFLQHYIRWLSERLSEAAPGPVGPEARSDIEEMLALLKAIRPRKPSGSRLSARMGLTLNDQRELVAACSARTAAPSIYPDIQQRDELIVQLLLGLGARAGELLSLKVADFDFVANEVVIVRRPDDPEDPRQNQPSVKTCDRRLPVSDELIRLVYDYITGPRRRFRLAKRHGFLLVVHRSGPYQGKPISARSLDKVLTRVGLQCGIPGLTPHVLRHTANERLSELMDEQNISGVREEQMRSYAMGWREGSGTAATYTRRHTATEAAKALRRLQGVLRAPVHK